MAEVLSLTSSSADKDRALIALTDKAAAEQLQLKEHVLSLGEELQCAKVEAETLGVVVMEKEASLTNVRDRLEAQVAAERAAKQATQDELDSANAQLAHARTECATLGAQIAQARTEVESFKADSAALDAEEDGGAPPRGTAAARDAAQAYARRGWVGSRVEGVGAGCSHAIAGCRAAASGPRTADGKHVHHQTRHR